jgi:molybdopterin/thiamine biosynthesis adenylyltransferase
MTLPQRLSKHTPILGEQGIQTVRRTKLAIAGMSGNGSPFALLAALNGFVKMTMIDPDWLEESNRNRFVFGGRKDVGKHKVDVAKEHLDPIDKEYLTHCVALPVDVRSRQGIQALSKADVIVSAVDSNEVRAFLQEQCSAQAKPLLDLGSGGLIQDGELRLLGSRASFYVPGGACLYHQTLDTTDSGLSDVSFATSNTVAAAVRLELLLSWLTGYGEQVNFALYDSIRHTLVTMNIAGDPHCPYCASSKPHDATAND